MNLKAKIYVCVDFDQELSSCGESKPGLFNIAEVDRWR